MYVQPEPPEPHSATVQELDTIRFAFIILVSGRFWTLNGLDDYEYMSDEEDMMEEEDQ